MEKHRSSDIMDSKSTKCDVCEKEFPSKTQLFKHLAVHGFESKDSKPTKVVVLVGWLSEVTIDDNEWISEQSNESHEIDVTSQRVEDELFRALYLVENNVDVVPPGVIIERPRGFSRGLGSLQRNSLVFGSEATCHGQCDTLCFQVKSFASIGKDAWKMKMNEKLSRYVIIHEVFILSPAAAPHFNAESDCTQRRYEYIFPLRYILPANAALPPEPIIRKRKSEMHGNLPKTSKLGAMDQRFPADTDEGQIRICFFRKMKRIFKVLAGKKRFHNFVTGGAAPADSCVMRKLDRIYHKEILTMDGEDWVVFSISGDAFLKGQVRKLIGLTLAIALDVFPLEYLDSVFEGDQIYEIPSVPGWAMYLAECRYARWEAKYLEFKLDPRREEECGNCEHIDFWTEGIHRHIASIARRIGSGWMQDFLGEAHAIRRRYEIVQTLKYRGRIGLEDIYERKFGSNALEQARVVYDEMGTVFAQIKAMLEEKKEQEKKKLEVECNSITENFEVAVEYAEQYQACCASRRTGNNVEYQQRVARLSFIDVPKEMDDVPTVFAKALYLLREADRSQLWPSSSTGRQQVIATTTLLELGGRGGSFSVGALPKHLVQPKGNIIFPGKNSCQLSLKVWIKCCVCRAYEGMFSIREGIDAASATFCYNCHQSSCRIFATS